VGNFSYLLTFFVLLPSILSSQNYFDPSQIRLNYITADNGLPQNTVDCILKDKQGFMWFGTWNGLCRYDGYSFITYQKGDSSVTLPGNFIQDICEDNEENLWIGTDKGIAFFSHNVLNFTKQSLLKNNIGSFNITCLEKNYNGDIYVGTSENGLWTISKNSKGNFVCKKILQRQLPSPNIKHLCLLKDQHLLIATTHGMAVQNPEGYTPNPKWSRLKNEMQGKNISVLFQDSKERIWIGTQNGLYLFNHKSLNITHFNSNTHQNNSLAHNSVFSIIEDMNGRIIIGTLGGLSFFNPQDQSFSHFPKNSGTKKYLNSPFINSLYTDKQGNIWIGTEKGGVNFYNTFQKPFHALKHDPANSNTISHNTINSVYKEDNVLWIGTAGGGLNKLTPNGFQIRYYKSYPNNPGSISSNFITSIFRDANKNLWVGTWGAGINLLLDENSNRFKAFTNVPGNKTSLKNNFVSCISKLNTQKLLIGTRGGIDVFNPKKNIFLHVCDKMQIEKIPKVGCVFVDPDKWVWMGSETGLYRFNYTDLVNFSSETASIAFDFFSQESPNTIPGNFITTIYKSNDGTTWFGTYGNGLIRHKTQAGKDKFINYTKDNGLCNNDVYSIEEDSNGNLWISTEKGLSKFNLTDTCFQNFYKSDGLSSDQFYWSSSCSDKSDNLYFGSIEGLNYFSPKKIDVYPFTPKPVFTNFLIFNTPVKVGEKFHSKIVLDAPLNKCKKIHLSYKDAVFSIEFSALDYFLPKKIKYKYKMEGVDQDWVEADANRRFANYTNLSGGEYIFKVKASNSDGIWCKTPAVLTINIKPPFWQTIWFYTLSALIIALSVIGYVRHRTSFLKEQKQKLKQQVQERTHQIEEQNLELEKQNEKIAKQRDEVIQLNEKVNLTNQLRLRFFTNISHEFRTPLTLIIDPLEQLMQNLKNDENSQKTLEIINRNAQRLLHLINQLLYFRKIETGKLRLNVCKGNLEFFLNEIFCSFSDLAKHQEIDYSIEIKGSPGSETWFDAEKIENVFYNLLSNAFKHTEISGKIAIKIQFHSNNNTAAPFVSIIISDSGTGIPKNQLPHIFDRFYKAANNKDSDFISSGIGLALTYEIVKAIHGEITVESTLGKGSQFMVKFPFTKASFSEDELNKTVSPGKVNIEGRINVLSDHIIARQTGYEEAGEQGSNHSKSTILIVEDNFDLRNFLMHSLRSEYRVLGAENGKIGLEMAKKYTPEIIISDVVMPIMDGIELCSHLKNNIQSCHIPVILLTARDLVENWIEGLETGADDYIPKPFNFKILQIKIRNMIESRRKLKQRFAEPEEIFPGDTTTSSLDENFLKKAFDILEKNYTNQYFSVEQFAKEMFVSQSLLYKKLKALTDMSISDFINSFKLKKAITMMRTHPERITDIAYENGFNDPKYFSRIFRKFYGISPSDFLKHLSNK
jgi:signal transduction histidine kinase/ligand-binding sensor domain-containing protein/DNA-binding response OmpR family regulator